MPGSVTRLPGAPARDVPKISLLSRAGLESVLWGLIIAHLVKWAVSFAYFAAWQVRYPGPVYGNAASYTLWYGKDFWDRLPVHAQNLLGQHWLSGQDAPAWWVTWRHDIRDVGIALIATIIVRLLFAKPKYPADDNPGLNVYLTRVPLAIGVALVPISAVGVLAWKLPWLVRHGVEVPAHYGALAAAANEWLAAGTWITAVMGIAGGLVATRVIQRVADDIQWFFAERSAGKSRRRVIGTPSHRLRVRWLREHALSLPARNPLLVRALLVIGFLSLAFAGAGAWLNLVGPAAH